MQVEFKNFVSRGFLQPLLTNAGHVRFLPHLFQSTIHNEPTIRLNIYDLCSYKASLNNPTQEWHSIPSGVMKERCSFFGALINMYHLVPMLRYVTLRYVTMLTCCGYISMLAQSKLRQVMLECAINRLVHLIYWGGNIRKRNFT
jgi:hypothetical protein